MKLDGISFSVRGPRMRAHQECAALRKRGSQGLVKRARVFNELMFNGMTNRIIGRTAIGECERKSGAKRIA